MAANIIAFPTRTRFTQDDLTTLSRCWPDGYSVAAGEGLGSLWIDQGSTVVTWEARQRQYVRWHQGAPVATGVNLAAVMG